MRSLILGAAALAACSAFTQANAQTADAYVGTWAFQTEDYGNDDYGATMSGVAVVAPGASANHYAVRLLAQELITQQESGQSRLLVAHETCSGEAASGQFTISCQLAEPLQGYDPDSFVLQQGERDQMVGVLSSATSGQVTFNRLR